MTVKTCIDHLKDKSDKIVHVIWSKAEFHPDNTWAFLHDLRAFGVEEFITNEILNKEVAEVNRYISNEAHCISISWK